MNTLQKIVDHKKTEIITLKKNFKRPFLRRDFTVITEIKLSSPSAGTLYTKDPLDLVKIYEEQGADAISVVTDNKYFGGNADLFSKIRAHTPLPMLRKDFILSYEQLVESREIGAAAVLLIAGIVDDKKLTTFVQETYKLGMNPIVEIYDTSQIETAIKTGTSIIGVNARNIKTMNVDIHHAYTVIQQIPSSIKTLLFSGISEPIHIHKAKKSGASGVLIGSSLLTSENPGNTLDSLLKKIS